MFNGQNGFARAIRCANRQCPVCYSPSWKDGPCVRQLWLEYKHGQERDSGESPGTLDAMIRGTEDTDIVSRAIDFMESLGLHVELWQAKALRRILIAETTLDQVYTGPLNRNEYSFRGEVAQFGSAAKYGGTRQVTDEVRGAGAFHVELDENAPTIGLARGEFPLERGEPGIGSSGHGGSSSEPYGFEGRTFIHDPDTGKTRQVGVPFLGVVDDGGVHIPFEINNTNPEGRTHIPFAVDIPNPEETQRQWNETC